jgi:hypothetical protein
MNLNRSAHSASNVGSDGTLKSSTNMVIIIAITASVKASILDLDIYITSINQNFL